jgi:hypothetical protein
VEEVKGGKYVAFLRVSLPLLLRDHLRAGFKLLVLRTGFWRLDVCGSRGKRQGFLLITTGIVISGLSPLLVARARRALGANLSALKPAIPMVAGVEVINLLAIYSRHRAVSHSHPSLIESIATTQTAYTFLLSLALWSMVPRLGDPQAGRRLWAKLSLVGAMVFGVRLVSGA